MSQEEYDDDVFVRPDEKTQVISPRVKEEDTIRVLKPPRRIPRVQTRSHGHISIDSDQVEMNSELVKSLGPALMPPYASKSMEHVSDSGRNSDDKDVKPKTSR